MQEQSSRRYVDNAFGMYRLNFDANVLFRQSFVTADQTI